MERTELSTLLAWKIKADRKPMIIRGARQVGKTWLMKTFGAAEYRQVAYLNFEGNPRLKAVFSQDFEIHRIIRALEIESQVAIEAGNTLLIFDEIQESPEALTSLKYFNENAPDYPILAAGSVLGVALHNQVSFPVGKVEFLDLHPFSYPEFLSAVGKKQLADLLNEPDWSLITAFKTTYIEMLKSYYYVGGMPECVAAFSANADFAGVRDIQKRILIAYENDFSKHAPNEIVPRIRMLWNSIPSQLARENKKFIYTHIKKGARARDFELAMGWLLDSGLIHRVLRVSKPGIPLKAYEDAAAFKLFLVDTGLLAAMGDLDSRSLLEGNDIFEEFKGSLTEQYVLQQLITKKDWVTYYWSAPDGQAEIDFVLQLSGNVIPLEVKAEENLKAKSLKVFADRFKTKISVRCSMKDYRKDEQLINLPLYAVLSLEKVLAGQDRPESLPKNT
jgi:uncharacterized protein